MNSSLFKCYANWELLTPATIVVLCWLLSTVQVLYPLLCIVPVLGTPKIDHSVKFDANIGKIRWKTYADFLPHRSGKTERCTHYEALVGLGHATGMATVNAMVFSYP